jgi:hypothetical protein
MPATLKLTHKAIGAEVRRASYDVVVDGERVGSVEMNDTIEIPPLRRRSPMPGCDAAPSVRYESRRTGTSQVPRLLISPKAATTLSKRAGVAEGLSAAVGFDNMADTTNV